MEEGIKEEGKKSGHLASVVYFFLSDCPPPTAGCVFPFKDSGKVCAGPKCCRTDGDKKPWCSTKVDPNGNHVNGNFQYCETCTAGTYNPFSNDFF